MSKKILYIGNMLSKHGNTPTSIETLGLLLEKEGYTLYYSSSKKNKIGRLFDMLFSTFYFAPRVNYVLIDVYSSQNFWYAILVSQICRLLKIKYIAKLHGGNLPYRLQKNPFLSDLIFKNAYSLSAPSRYLVDAFEVKYKKNLVYIPNTIEVENYKFHSRVFDSPKLLWVRSFSTIYNPRMAIKVLAKLKQKYPNATLCMVGPDKENLIEDCKKYAIELGVDVDFPGRLSKKKWTKLALDYNVFINTTHFDNTPISVIEAMALGLPVVSTNVGGIPFLLKNYQQGILVNDDDDDAMVVAINQVMLDSKLRNDVIQSARSLAETFDWSKVKLKWIEILE
jgi:L-malate glycosyltransferase